MPSELVPTSAPFVPQKATSAHTPVNSGRNEPRMKPHASSKPPKHLSRGQGGGRNHKGSSNGGNSCGDKSARGGKGSRGNSSGKGGKGSSTAASSSHSSTVPAAALSPLDQEAAEEADALAAVEAFLAAEAAESEAGGNSKSGSGGPSGKHHDGSGGASGGRRQKGKALDHLLRFQFAKPEAVEPFAPPSHASSSSVRSSTMGGASSSSSNNGNRWWNSSSGGYGSGGGRSRQPTSVSASRGGRLHLVLCPAALSARINPTATAPLPPGASNRSSNNNKTTSTGLNGLNHGETKSAAGSEAPQVQVPAYEETAQRWGVSNKPAWMNRPEYQPTTGTTGTAEEMGRKGKGREKGSSNIAISSGNSTGSARSSTTTTPPSISDIAVDPDDDSTLEWSEVVAMVAKVDSLSEAVCPVTLEPFDFLHVCGNNESSVSSNSRIAFGTKCGHTFHPAALMRVLASSRPLCPFCAEAIDVLDLRPAVVEVCPPPSVGATVTFHLLAKGQNHSPPQLVGNEHYASSSSSSAEEGARKSESDATTTTTTSGLLREEMFKENGSDHRHSHHHSSSLSIFGEPNAKFAPFSVAYDPSSSTLSSSSWGLKLLLERLTATAAEMRLSFESSGDFNYIPFATEAEALVEAWHDRWVRMPSLCTEDGGASGSGSNSGDVVDAPINAPAPAAVGLERGSGGGGALAGEASDKTQKWLYLYQLADGQRAFLHPLNVKCLLHASGHLITTAPPPPPNHSLEKAYAPGTAKVAEEESSTNSSSDSSSGSDSSSSGGDKDSNSSSAHVSANGASSILTLPTTLSGEVLEVEVQKVTHELRRRCAFLRHLPLGVHVSFVELELSSQLPPSTLAAFSTQLNARRKAREKVKQALGRAQRQAQQDEARHRKEVKSRLQASLPPTPEAFSATLPSSPLSSPQLAPQQPLHLSSTPPPAPLATVAGAPAEEDSSLSDSSSSTAATAGTTSLEDTSGNTTASAASNRKTSQQQLPSFSRIARDGVLKASDRHFPSLSATAAAAAHTPATSKAGKGHNSPSLKPLPGWGAAPPSSQPLNHGIASKKGEALDSGDGSGSTSHSTSS